MILCEKVSGLFLVGLQGRINLNVCILAGADRKSVV